MPDQRQLRDGTGGAVRGLLREARQRSGILPPVTRLAFLVLGAIALFCAPFASRAEAQPPSERVARALFDDATTAAGEERWADAADGFREAYSQSNAPAALYNYALALRALGQYLAAREALDRFERDHSDHQMAGSAREVRAGLAERVARLTLGNVPEGASVMYDGEAGPTSTELDPGRHTIVVDAEGYESWVHTLDLAEGADATVAVELSTLPTGGSNEGGEVSVGAWTLMGVGAAALAASIGTGVTALQIRGDLEERCVRDATGFACDEAALEDRDRGELLAITTDVLIGVGAATAIAGIAWAVAGALGGGSDDEEEAQADSTSFALTGADLVCASRGCVGVVEGRW